MIKLVAKEVDKAVKELEGEKKRIRKAHETAVRVEGFRLMQLLKQELKAGRAGGRTFHPLSEIAKRTGKGVRRNPLARLAVAVRYGARRQGDAFVTEVGFVDTGRRKLSKSWKRIAEFQQVGGRRPVSEDLRRSLIRMGERHKKRPYGKFFFLRKETTHFETQPRPIIEPFWAMHRAQAERNIEENWERKMRGKRI